MANFVQLILEHPVDIGLDNSWDDTCSGGNVSILVHGGMKCCATRQKKAVLTDCVGLTWADSSWNIMYGSQKTTRVPVSSSVVMNALKLVSALF